MSTDEANGFQQCNLTHSAAAQRLIADTIAQRRNRVARLIIFHPYSLLAFGVLITLVMYNNQRIFTHGEVGNGMLLLAGLIMAYLVAIERLTATFLDDARRTEERSDLIHVKEDTSGQTYIYTRDAEVLAAITAVGTSSVKPTTRVEGWAVKLAYRKIRLGADIFDMLLETLSKDTAVEVPTLSVDREAERVLKKRGFSIVKAEKYNGLLGVFIRTHIWRVEELTQWEEMRDSQQQYFAGFSDKKEA